MDGKNNERSERLAENVKVFQQFIDEFFEEIEKDESFHIMTAESYDKKKCYIRAHLLELSLMHTALADQYAELIEQVRKNYPSRIQKQHHMSSTSRSPPKVTSGFDVFCLSDFEAFLPSSVKKPPVPSVIDDALKVKEEINLSKGEGSLDLGLESFVSSVYEPLVLPLNDDALKVEEIKDSGSEDEVLLEKISNLGEDVASLKQELESLTDENGELKLEIEEEITDCVLEIEAMKLKSEHEKKEKIWNGVTKQLKDKLKKQCELVDEPSKKTNRKDGQSDNTLG